MNDSFNLTLVKPAKAVDTIHEVDAINRKFYERYNYPWQPASLIEYPVGIAEVFLNQDVGNWGHTRISPGAKIWVAGCGTNQALITALKFPAAQVVGTDISSVSLQVCRKNADQLGVKNLALECKSLNAVTYHQEFDYIMSTGVIHHNADPEATLQHIVSALKPNGILELMVYNFYHRLLNTACQKAVRSFYDYQTGLDLELELGLVSSLISEFQDNSYLGNFLQSYKNAPEASRADDLMQPVHYSYTIESFQKLTEACNLEFLLYCPNQFDTEANTLSWNFSFRNEMLRSRYLALDDLTRWQIANLLMLDKSPWLWFYFQKPGSIFKRESEHVVCDRFLETRFERVASPVKRYSLTPQGKYVFNGKLVNLQRPLPANSSLATIVQTADGKKKMKDILHQLGISPQFEELNTLRMRLTTSMFPYLLAKE